MALFLSYSAANKKVAERLRWALEREGLSVWSAQNATSDSDLRRQMEEAIRSAEAILVLVGPREKPDKVQQFTWQEALEAVWKDPGKRIIPLLIGDAKIPAFVFSNGVPSKAIRISDPRDGLSMAAILLAATLRPVAKGPVLRGLGGDDDLYPLHREHSCAEFDEPAGYVPREELAEQYEATKAEGNERLAENRDYVERLKAHHH
jgi:hypothetical protein